MCVGGEGQEAGRARVWGRAGRARVEADSERRYGGHSEGGDNGKGTLFEP